MLGDESETPNPVRSFKGRGTETVAAVAREPGASRVVCASAGNLGQAPADSGRRRGLQVTVVAARTANPLKLRQIAAFGAEAQLAGEDSEDARRRARGSPRRMAPFWSRTAWIWRPARALPRSASSSSETTADGVAGRCPIPEVLDHLLVVVDDPILVREDSIKGRPADDL